MTHLDGLHAAYYYSDEIEKLVALAKYEFVYSAIDRWAELIQDVVPAKYYEDSVLVPIPLAPRKQRWRGFNQTELLARRLSKRWQVPTANVLQRTRYTETQVGMGREARWSNLRGAFEVAPSYLPEQKTQTTNLLSRLFLRDIPAPASLPIKVLLIDDVMTTGTTLEQCAQALKAAGVEQVYAAVLARGAAPPVNFEKAEEESL